MYSWEVPNPSALTTTTTIAVPISVGASMTVLAMRRHLHVKPSMVRLGDERKVVDVMTCLVTAQVVNLMPFRDGSNLSLPLPAMGAVAIGAGVSKVLRICGVVGDAIHRFKLLPPTGVFIIKVW